MPPVALTSSHAFSPQYEKRHRSYMERDINKEMEEKSKMLAESLAEKEWVKGRDARVSSWQGFQKRKKRRTGVKRREDTTYGAGSTAQKGSEYKKKWR